MKQKTEQQISISKLKETIDKMQTNMNNLHENITKLNDTEITKSQMFSYKNISQNKEIFKSTSVLEADNFETVSKYHDTDPRCENIKFLDDQNNKRCKSYRQDVLNLEKRQSSWRSISFLYTYVV